MIELKEPLLSKFWAYVKLWCVRVPCWARRWRRRKKIIDFFLNVLKKVVVLCCIYFLIHYRGNFIVKLWFGCHFFLGAKLSVLLCWCLIVLFLILVPNCPFSYFGAKLSVCLFGAKLSVLLHISWCKIVRVQKYPVPICPTFHPFPLYGTYFFIHPLGPTCCSPGGNFTHKS